MYSYSKIIETAKNIMRVFRPIAEETPYMNHGMLYSEVLFLLSCVELTGATRVLESGTSGGQSTLLLAKSLPSKEIITVEYNSNSPQAGIAKERLGTCSNVTQVFGDSNIEMPRLITPNSVVVIDGPKMFLAIRLALRLLQTGNIAGVFIHDVNIGTPERRFLDAYFPEARFSDAMDFASVFHVLDGQAVNALRPEQRIDGVSGAFGYGFGLVWIPYTSFRSYRGLLWYSFVYDAFSRPQDIVSRLRRKFSL